MSQEHSSNETNSKRLDDAPEGKGLSESKNNSEKVVRGSKITKNSPRTKVNADNFEIEDLTSSEFGVNQVSHGFGPASYSVEGGFASDSGDENFGEASFSQFSTSGFNGNTAAAASGASSSMEFTGQAAGTAYATDAQGVFQDPNPQVIKRAALGGPQVFTQRVMVRFLQPPPVPAPGPLIIKEVRPPQPPPPPPLYIRQRPPPAPPLPPLVIRERPPKLPPPIGTQIITKVLPPIPVPPRSVIIERLPPLPPKPRDVIVERWLPYRTTQKRRIIVQRAPPAPVQKPRNIIIYYEQPKARIVRRFENLGIQMANPREYVARYGTQLEDSQSLITHARRAGVIEDINPPGNSMGGAFGAQNYTTYESSNFNAGANSFAEGFSTVEDSQFGVAGANTDANLINTNFTSFGDFNQWGNFDQGLSGSTVDNGAVNAFENVVQSASGYETYSSAENYGF